MDVGFAKVQTLAQPADHNKGHCI